MTDLPSQKEIDEHMLTHIPFRSWCKFCVMGKSVASPHRKIDKSEDTVPTVSIDYAFLNDKQEVIKEENAGMPILAIKDRKTGMMQSRVVPAKGNDKFAIKRLVKDIELLGYNKVILKSDNESSILALKKSVKETTKVEIILEESPVGDHQGNGEVENAIKRFAGQFRTLREALETRYQKRITQEHHALPWLINYSSGCINRYQVGSDGKTSHRKWKGKDFNRVIPEFGECILALKLDSVGKAKSKVRWIEAIFLGVREETGELIVGTPEGVIKARDFHKHGSDEERWNVEKFDKFRGVPWATVPGYEQDDIKSRIVIPTPAGPVLPPETTQEKPMHAPRRMALKQEDVVKAGLTKGCPGCLDINAGRGGMRGSATHNEECRANVESYLRRTKSKRMQAYDDIITERIVRFTEDKQRKRPKVQEEDTFVEAEVFDEGDDVDSDVPIRDAADNLAPQRYPDAFAAFDNLEEEMDTRSSRKRSQRASEEDEEEQARAMKYQIHESEIQNEESDATMSSINKVWICSFSQNTSLSLNVEQYLSEIKTIHKFMDDRTGKSLDTELVLEARLEELTEVKKHNVYKKVPIAQCMERTGRRPIGTRWVDINKGDDIDPKYRSRIVAQEFNNHKRDDLFAATPPLEAIKILLSCAVTQEIGYKDKVTNGMKIDFIDVRRAYYHADARREVYVALPPGDEEEGMCGLLVKSLQGTRDAAQNWEAAYSNLLTTSGFTQGKATPCMFYHKERQLRLVVHGDDFTILGNEENLDWFRKAIQETFEVTIRGRIGPSPRDSKSIKLLNRVIEWNDQGITYEADQRHADMIVGMLGYQVGVSKSLSIPGEKYILEETVTPLASPQATQFRAIVARANYLAQDRSDIMFAVKELTRHMSKPTETSWTLLKRLGRYLLGSPRVVLNFPYQSVYKHVDVWTDSDWAGDRMERKSISGGVIRLGSHSVKLWSSTQKSIALSSGEAEYYALVKGGSIGIGISSMLSDFGVVVDSRLHIHTDSSAAKGICSRRGLGKVRHIDIHMLWIQDRVYKGDIIIKKVCGEDNISDALTKHVDAGKLTQHLQNTGQELLSGRHTLMPNVTSHQ